VCYVLYVICCVVLCCVVLCCVVLCCVGSVCAVACMRGQENGSTDCKESSLSSEASPPSAGRSAPFATPCLSVVPPSPSLIPSTIANTPHLSTIAEDTELSTFNAQTHIAHDAGQSHHPETCECAIGLPESPKQMESLPIAPEQTSASHSKNINYPGVTTMFHKCITYPGEDKQHEILIHSSITYPNHNITNSDADNEHTHPTSVTRYFVLKLSTLSMLTIFSDSDRDDESNGVWIQQLLEAKRQEFYGIQFKGRGWGVSHAFFFNLGS
jgi:hypothetical protein